MKESSKWLIQIFIITFMLSLVFSSVSNVVVDNLNIYIAIIVLIMIIGIGIFFDIIGMAVATCPEAPFHAKAAKKHRGAKEVLKLIKSREKVASVCNDVVGDVSGIVSGSISALIALKLATILRLDIMIVSLVIGGIVAALTVGGKAIGKDYAINSSESILYFVGAVLHYVAPVKERQSAKHKKNTKGNKRENDNERK